MRVRRIAILIDGGFFVKRLKHIVAPKDYSTPEAVANTAYKMCKRHVQNLLHERRNTPQSKWLDHVYRVFYYDAHPFMGTAHNPISNLQIKYNNSTEAQFRLELFSEIKRKRKFALRLGKVSLEGGWYLKDERTRKKLLQTSKYAERLELLVECAKAQTPSTLTPDDIQQISKLLAQWKEIGADDVRLGLRQKGVDMRIGVDISTLTLKSQVDTIILITGDSDFVPAAKVARREGVEFLLDPLGQAINDDLNEHVDGIVSGFQKNHKTNTLFGSEPDQEANSAS